MLGVGREHRGAARDQTTGLAIGEAPALEERPHPGRHPRGPGPPAVLVQRRDQRHPGEVAEQPRRAGEAERRRRELHVRDVRSARAQVPGRPEQAARAGVHRDVDHVHAPAVERLGEVDGVVGDTVVRGIGASVDERDTEVGHSASVPDPGRAQERGGARGVRGQGRRGGLAPARGRAGASAPRTARRSSRHRTRPRARGRRRSRAPGAGRRRPRGGARRRRRPRAGRRPRRRRARSAP